MKRFFTIAIVLLFVAASRDAVAQSMFKRIGKAVEKEVVNQLNKSSNKQEEQQKQQQQQPQSQRTSQQRVQKQTQPQTQRSTAQSHTTQSNQPASSDIYRNPYVVGKGTASVEPLVLIDGIEYRLDRQKKTAVVESVAPTWKKKLTQVRIWGGILYNDVLYPVVAILPRVFYGETLTAIRLPNTLQEIGDSAFKTSSLKSVVIPSSVKYLGFAAFSMSALETVTLNEGLERLDDWVFSECKQLRCVDLPYSVTAIGRGTFNYCLKLTSVRYNRDLKTIPDSTFKGCKCLTSFILSGELDEIGPEAFRDSGLRSISIPLNVRVVGNDAFADCKQMTNVLIPSTIQRMGDNAFAGCPALQKIHISSKYKDRAKMVKIFGSDCRFITSASLDTWQGVTWGE